MKYKIGFIGLGNMAEALIKSFTDKKLAKAMIGYDVNEERAHIVSDKYKVLREKSIKGVEKESEIIFLAVKPQNFNDVLPQLKSTKKIIISIAAGIKISRIEGELKSARVIRVMPNTPCLVGEMAGAMAVGSKVKDDDKIAVLELLNSAGKIFLFDEKYMDIVTALSGSGPAFFAYAIDQMAKSAIEEGLDELAAYELAAKTAQGTGKLLIEKGLKPEELIKMVSSPDGTTVAGRAVLENKNTEKIIKDTIKAAYKRSKELSK